MKQAIRRAINWISLFCILITVLPISSLAVATTSNTRKQYDDVLARLDNIAPRDKTSLRELQGMLSDLTGFLQADSYRWIIEAMLVLYEDAPAAYTAHDDDILTNLNILLRNKAFLDDYATRKNLPKLEALIAYQSGRKAEAEERLQDAASYYLDSQLADYLDRLTKHVFPEMYRKAASLEEAKKYADAADLYKFLDDNSYNDSKSRYKKAVELAKLTPSPMPKSTSIPDVTPTSQPVLEFSPTPMPYMAAGAAEGTDPELLKLTSKAYSENKAVNEFERTISVKMNAPDNYAAWSGAVLTFRGGPFRQNAACGTADVQENKLEVVWSAPMGGIESHHGAGWTGQPAIVKWPKEVREAMNLTDAKKAVSALKEVILASQDGKIYFLDLADGQPTRDPINVGYPLMGSVSVDPRGMPMLSVGQGVSKLKTGTGEIGYFLFNLINQKQLDFINGRDKNAFGLNGAFDGSSLLDLNSDTMIIAGENGMLYTVWLNTTFDVKTAKLEISSKIASYKAKTSKQKDTATGIESSVAMYGNYAYFADATGIMQCVDVNTMKPVWAVDCDDNTDATPALDFDQDGSLALYTGNTVKEQGKNGVCTITIRRLNALTGEQDWSYTVKVDYDKDEASGCMASPVVGQQSIGSLVIFTVAKTPEGGQIIALDKKTGHVVWQQSIAHYSWSSPVAVYNADGDAWIIQGDSEGVLQLIDGQTGAVRESIQLEAAITGSPAVYNDMLVVGTSGKGVSKIYGICIK